MVQKTHHRTHSITQRRHAAMHHNSLIRTRVVAVCLHQFIQHMDCLPRGFGALPHWEGHVCVCVRVGKVSILCTGKGMAGAVASPGN